MKSIFAFCFVLIFTAGAEADYIQINGPGNVLKFEFTQTDQLCELDWVLIDIGNLTGIALLDSVDGSDPTLITRFGTHSNVIQGSAIGLVDVDPLFISGIHTFVAQFYFGELDATLFPDVPVNETGPTGGTKVLTTTYNVSPVPELGNAGIMLLGGLLSLGLAKKLTIRKRNS